MFSLLLLTTGVFIFFICLLVLLGNIFANLYTSVPYAPTPHKTVEKILNLINLQPGERLYDLGSGDGRVLFAAEKLGAKAYGFELSPFSYIRTALKIKLKKSAAKIFYKNFYSAKLEGADVIFCFLVGWVMPKLQKKLEKELKPGTRVVSYGFSFPGWTPEKIISSNNSRSAVYFYTIKD